MPSDQDRWSQGGYRFEQQADGLWHMAWIDEDGRLVSRTTVVQNTHRVGPVGAVGSTELITRLLEETARQQRGGPRQVLQQQAGGCRRWARSIPDQEEPEDDAHRPLVISADGAVGTPSEDRTELGAVGHISHFRDRGLTVFEAWQSTADAGSFGLVPLLERSACPGHSDATERMRYEDEWWDVVLQWWAAAHRHQALQVHASGVWALAADYVGPATPKRIA